MLIISVALIRLVLSTPKHSLDHCNHTMGAIVGGGITGKEK
jgi:hypothetical protein